jgi:hypothetical protein
MNEFTEDMIVGKGNNFIYSGDLVYYFKFDNKGMLIENDNELFFSWSINKKGILLLKFEDKINYIKLISRTENILITEIYNKIGEKVIKDKEVDFTIDTFEDDTNNTKDEFLKNIIIRIKSFDYIDYSSLALIIIFSFTLINFLSNQIIFIKDFRLSIKSIFIIIFIFYYKEAYIYLTIAVSNKIKKVFNI